MTSSRSDIDPRAAAHLDAIDTWEDEAWLASALADAATMVEAIQR